MRQLVVLTVILFLLTACISAVSPSKGISSETGTRYRPSKIQEASNGFLEIEGVMKSEGEMWALLFFRTAYANEEAKIVWRITGESAEFQAQAQNEEGTVIEPIWVEYHEGSNWERPEQECGTGFNFPGPGCWTITVSRGEIEGEISLVIKRKQILEEITSELGEKHVKADRSI